MPALTFDLASPLSLPATWTGHHVKMRLLEAYQIERRMPEPRLPRPRPVRSTWPTAYREFHDYVGWSSEAREAVLVSWEQSRGVLGWEISRMNEALSWLAMLANYHDEQDSLEIWAKVAALSPGRLTKELRKRKMSRTTLYRHVGNGAARIAAELNKKGVAVR